MIIELTGPTCSGKSTFASSLSLYYKALGFDVHHIGFVDKATTLIPLSLSNPLKQSYWSDIVSIPWSAIFCLRYTKYFLFVVSYLILKGDKKHIYSIIRSIWRKFAIYQLLDYLDGQNNVFIVDEGICHVAHNVLVSSIQRPTEKDIEIFSRLTPTYDITYFITASTHVLSKRQLSRFDPSPRSKDNRCHQGFLENSKYLFDILYSYMIDSDRLVQLVLNEESDGKSFYYSQPD